MSFKIILGPASIIKNFFPKFLKINTFSQKVPKIPNHYFQIFAKKIKKGVSEKNSESF